MEFLIRTVATAAIVALMLLAVRRFGHRTAGVMAGLPFTTVPALGWTAATGGTELASRTSIGSVFGCIIVPLFAVAYDRTARKYSPRRSLVASLGAVVCGVMVASHMPATLWTAAALCAAGSVAALCALRGPRPVQDTQRHASCPPSSIAFSAVLVGALSATIAALAMATSPQLAGLLAGLPTLGMVTLLRQHGVQGAACVTPFLRGYVISTLGRALFGVVFASMAVPLGPTPAMLAAIVAGVTFCIVANGIDRRCAARQPTAPRPTGDAEVKRTHRVAKFASRCPDPRGASVQSMEGVDRTAHSHSTEVYMRSPARFAERPAFSSDRVSTRIVALAVAALLAIATPSAPAQDRRTDSMPTSVTLVARVVLSGLRGAHGISQVGRFHVGGPFVANPEFLLSTQPGRVLDPERVLVTTDADGGTVLSIDTSARNLRVPVDLRTRPHRAADAIQVYSAAAPTFANAAHNSGARTAGETAVASPRYLSINNAFGRLWIANAPNGLLGDGTLSVTDPDGAPLANAPSDAAGGVFAGDRTPRTSVPTTMQAGWFAARFERRASGQLTRGSLEHGTFGTAFLGTSPDGTGFAVFAAVTGSGAVVQVHVQDGVDGLAPDATIDIGHTDPGLVGMAFQWAPHRVLFIAEAVRNQIAVLRVKDDGHQFVLDGVDRLRSPWLQRPVDLAPAVPEVANPRFASHTTLSEDSDLYVANQGDGSLLRMTRNGGAIARAMLTRADGRAVGPGELRAITVSSDAQTIWVIVHSPGTDGDQLLEMQAFDGHGVFRTRDDAMAAAQPTANAESGARLFAQMFTVETGLGPRFNAASCESCHAGARGANSHEEFFARRIARMDPRSGRIIPIDGLDSTVAPRRSLAEPGLLAPPREANVVSLRMPLALVAAAHIDEIDDAAIEAQAVAKGDGIHGRVHRVTDATGATHIGRYGWKADVATLDDMVAAAFADELGMPSVLAPRPHVPIRDDGTMAHAVAAFLRGGSGPLDRPLSVDMARMQERAP